MNILRLSSYKQKESLKDPVWGGLEDYFMLLRSVPTGEPAGKPEWREWALKGHPLNAASGLESAQSFGTRQVTPFRAKVVPFSQMGNTSCFVGSHWSRC